MMLSFGLKLGILSLDSLKNKLRMNLEFNQINPVVKKAKSTCTRLN